MNISKKLTLLLAWLLAIIWLFPLLYAIWSAFHPAQMITQFSLLAPITLDNFKDALNQAPFARYMLNTMLITLSILAAQLVICTLAAYALARIKFKGRALVFAAVLLQLMVVPEILIIENYQTLSQLNGIDSILGVGLPYFASAFAIFLLRQSFMCIPQDFEDAARIEGMGVLSIIWRVYVPLAKPTYLAFALVSISYHWNNFLWPLVITNTQASRPITVGMAIFGAPESGVDWAIICAGTLISVSPLLVVFVVFQKQFVQSFIHAGIK